MYGNDYQGNTCGVSDQKSRKYTVYPRVNEVSEAASGSWPRGRGMMRLERTLPLAHAHKRSPAPQDFLINLGKTNPLDYKFYGVCVSRCPASLDVV